MQNAGLDEAQAGVKIARRHVNNLRFPGGSGGKASPCNMGDLGSIAVSGRSSGEGNGHPFQYSSLENSTDGGAWRATAHGIVKSQIRLNDWTQHI